MNKRQKPFENKLDREFQKAKPPTFDGDEKSIQGAKAWLLGMMKYFQANDYSRNMKEMVSIFSLNGRESIWWDHLRKVKNINDKKIVWKQFKKYFKQKYLSDRYYHDNIKEFHEMRLGQLTME